jgi:hypothetical protein
MSAPANGPAANESQPSPSSPVLRTSLRCSPSRAAATQGDFLRGAQLALAFGKDSDSPRRLLPAWLRCSAAHMGSWVGVHVIENDDAIMFA